MSAPVVQGWCPGALRPMASGDGLILRVRPPAGRLDAGQVAGIADLAQSCGNGMIDLTRRANVQLRGLTAKTLPAAQRRLQVLGLLDPALDPDTEAGVNIMVDPFLEDGAHFGLAGGNAGLALWAALRAGLVAATAPRLPAKFGFAIDLSPGIRHLAAESADIRLETGAQHPTIVRADGAQTGRPVASAAQGVALAVALARWFAQSGGIGADGRGRMRDHLARGAVLPASLSGSAHPAEAAEPRAQLARVIGFDFGAARAAGFARLPRHIVGPLRITPWRGVTGRAIMDRDGLGADPDLILDAADPRHRRFACVGSAGCAQGLGDPRALAARHRLLPPAGASVHIAGCAKGCAHPAPAAVTLTCTGPGLRLARPGRAGEGVCATLAEIKALLQADPDAP